MKALRILLLVHESLVPPSDLVSSDESEIEDCRTEYNVMSTLANLGHEVRVLGIGDSLRELRIAIRDWKPDLTFNLLEEFSGIVTYDHYVVAYLELMRQPYSGCNPRGMMISRDKVLSKQVLAYHRIATPRFHVFPRNRKFVAPRRLEYPLFVKSATEDASLGISQASIVTDRARLQERVEFIHHTTASDALVEEYIEGRELYIGVMGNERLTTLPIWEMRFGRLTNVQAGIATRRVKWDPKYQKHHGIETGPATDIKGAAQQRLTQLAKRVYRSLYMSGYARMDLRMKSDGSVFVLEANANPNLTYGEDFAESADVVGMKYPQLLQRIVNLGLSYRPEWRLFES
ncbi:MAG: ATP-grasp domain-containing protein [Steroidobacteraceae bacterium]